MNEQMPTYKELKAYWELTHNDHEKERKEWIRKQDEKIKEDLLGNGSFLYAGVNLPRKYEKVISQIISESITEARISARRLLANYLAIMLLGDVVLFAIILAVRFIGG